MNHSPATVFRLRAEAAEAALADALKREEEFAGYHNDLISDQAEKVEALSDQVTQQAATISQLRKALQDTHDSYYSRTPLQSVISIVEAALASLPKEN